jgi:hypothetical protein
MAYDRRRHVTVLFGGAYGANASLGDTWEWDGVDWTERTPALGPEPRSGAVMIYHPLRRTIMLVDGGDSMQGFGDTWEWDGTTWTKVPAVLAAPPLFSAGAAFDAHRGEMTAFGVDIVGTTYLKLTLSFAYSSAAAPHDSCDAAMDTDGDGLVGCADPDCWGRCAPLCPPGEVCDPAAPHCGDGTCSVLEDHKLCPDDCL